MTAPVWLSATDVALAARRHLVGRAAVRAALGPASSTPETVWLFTRKLGVVVEGSGLAAVVLSVEGGWARPNVHNTALFPRLIVDVYADPSRSAARTILRPDAESRAWAVWRVFRRELHRPYAFAEVWGAVPSASPPDPGLRVWGSQSLLEPEPASIPDWDGGVRLRSEFGLNTS